MEDVHLQEEIASVLEQIHIVEVEIQHNPTNDPDVRLGRRKTLDNLKSHLKILRSRLLHSGSFSNSAETPSNSGNRYISGTADRRIEPGSVSGTYLCGPSAPSPSSTVREYGAHTNGHGTHSQPSFSRASQRTTTQDDDDEDQIPTLEELMQALSQRHDRERTALRNEYHHKSQQLEDRHAQEVDVLQQTYTEEKDLRKQLRTVRSRLKASAKSMKQLIESGRESSCQ